MNDINQFLRMLAYEERMAASKLETVKVELAGCDEKNSSIVIKKIKGHLYYYEQWREEGKLRSKFLGAVAPGSVAAAEQRLLSRQRLEKQKKDLETLLSQIQTAKKRAQEELGKQPILKEYSFEVYWKDEITARVYVKKSEVVIARFTEHPLKQIFAKNRMTRNQLNRILELRCWDRNRPDLPELLHSLGLEEFNPQEIVRRTHGVMWNDYLWFRFPGEKITCKDVLVRDF